jgi:hypothetical protein
MATTISKILFRRGTNFERLCAENIGVTLSMGEPGYTADTKRFYIGDGQTVGGIPVGVKNLGAVNQLFGAYAGTGYSEQAYWILRLSGVEVGDILYDRDTRILYSLTGRSSFPPLTSEFVKYDFTVQLDPDIFFFNSQDQIEIKPEAITPPLVSSSLAGGGLQKLTVNDPIRIAPEGVTNARLYRMPPYSVKLNDKTFETVPVDLVCGPKQFIGRSGSSPLTALNFETIFTESSILTDNGIAIERPTPNVSIFSLSSNVFQVNASKANILLPTTVNATLSVQARTTIAGTVAISGATLIGNRFVADEINTRNGRLNSGTGIISGGDLYCRDIFIGGTGGVSTNGGPIGTGGGAITTAGGNINAGSGQISCGVLYSTGDVVAFSTSDARLKDEIIPLENSLIKLDNIDAYTFTWIKDMPQELNYLNGEDIGLIAQEVKAVVPCAVTERSDGYLGVDYTKIVPFLVSCVKDLKNEVHNLKNEIQQLRK